MTRIELIEELRAEIRSADRALEQARKDLEFAWADRDLWRYKYGELKAQLAKEAGHVHATSG